MTVHVGKWMKEQNVIAAGHGWEQCLLRGTGYGFEYRVLVETLDTEDTGLLSRLKEWTSAIPHRQKHSDDPAAKTFF